LPKVEPWQVKPDVPPHEPSVETVRLAVAVGADDVEVAVADDVSSPQLPNEDWHPVPQ
jgi:hypothetical protein